MEIVKMYDRSFDVVDGQNRMGWMHNGVDAYIKYHAVVNGQIYRIKYGVWIKYGRGKAKEGNKEILCNLEKYFRDHINEIVL